MKIRILLIIFLLINAVFSFAQKGWVACSMPALDSRVDDIYMVNTKVGFSVCAGTILKTIDGGSTWQTLRQDSIYYRSVEFITEKKGFAGAFPFFNKFDHILMRTEDGGNTWTDLTSTLNPAARSGICGLAVADSNTIYGCGNWFQDSAYIIKSIDGGNTWNFIDMHNYAASLIDMHFINKDTGFATGRGTKPLNTAVVLYTTDGGKSWQYKFENTLENEYCWKIQKLTNKIYFASIEDMIEYRPRIIKSEDGGMTWQKYIVAEEPYNIEGIGFIDSIHGWTGGDEDYSFESNDGGTTWKKIYICQTMNRVFKVNDTLLFATGWSQIWKYTAKKDTIVIPPATDISHTSIRCYPIPVRGNLTIEVSLEKPTRAMIILFDNQGKMIRTIENADKPNGFFTYYLNTANIANGIYYMVLKTHEDKHTTKIIVSH